LSPDRQKERTVDAVLGWLSARAEHAPVLFVVEDLHWVDPSTEALLARFVEDGGEARVLGVFTFRPEYDPPWKGKAVQTQVALNRLTRSQVGELVRVQGGAVVPTAVVDQIVDRTDGVPLFVEEFTRLVAEGGKNGGIDTAIPASLQDLLLARLDRMASDREIVQLGATIGRTFRYDLIRAASRRDEATLRGELGKLVEAGLLFPKGSPPRCTYTFKHALIQDAAYQSLVKKQRHAFHRAVADALQQEFPEVGENQPELLARHLTEAGETERAISYWLAAALHAQGRFALGEAAQHFDRGLGLVASLPPSADRDRLELKFQLPRSAILTQQKGYAAAEVGEVMERAKRLCQLVGDPSHEFFTLRGLYAWRALRGEMDLALALGGEIMDLTRSRLEKGFLNEAHFTLCCAHLYRGEFAPAATEAERGFAHYNPETCRFLAQHIGQNAGVTNQIYWSVALWSLGRPQAALNRGRKAVELACQLDDPFSHVHALNHLSWVEQFCRLGQAAVASATEAIRISEKQGFGFWVAVATMSRGAGRVIEGDLAGGVADLHRGMAGFRATGARLLETHYAMLLGDALLRSGLHDEALAEVDAGLAHACESGVRFVEPELHRLRGEILLAQPCADLAVVEECFRQGIDLARCQDAVSWELRAAISLTRLLDRQDRGAEGRVLLTDLVGRFAGALKFPDLVEARQLLDPTESP
jgi:predicted ATPase